MAKRVIKACVEKILDFDTEKERAAFVEDLREGKKEFIIIRRWEEGEHLYLRIKEQYNKNKILKD